MRKRGDGCRVAGLLGLVSLVSLMSGSAAAQVAETFGLADHRLPVVEKAESRPLSERLGLDLDAGRDLVGQVMLPPVDVERLLEEDAAQEPWDKVLRWGVGRDIAVEMTDGVWHDLPGLGRLWVVDVVAAEAMAMRIQFSDMNLPEGAQLYAYSVADSTKVAGPYAGTGLFDTGEFWGPTLLGDQVRIELFVPRAADLQVGMHHRYFRVGRIQHMYRDPVQEAFLKGEFGDERGAGSCHNDVSCYPGWADVAKASAGIGWVNSNSLWCSGTMLNTTANDQTPYWLTANHCLSTAGDAQSAEIYWLYQRNGCGGSIPSVASVPQSATCQLMGTGSASDYTLLMIRGELPTGLFWAGWYSGTVSNGQDTACIHHPSGDYKRISFGTKGSNTTNFVRINWYDGPTEPGSSGSGIFRTNTQQLYGQLCCGISACGSETWDDYGYFFRSYPNISSLLAAGSDDN
ncbi:MAG: trypsin-like peptidase domain-containing protein, partial [Phycisphaerales bacterium]|nr:trypsin-like peptidase domain-containing protein [Phycisphaerales bacterium]